MLALVEAEAALAAALVACVVDVDALVAALEALVAAAEAEVAALPALDEAAAAASSERIVRAVTAEMEASLVASPLPPEPR